MMWEQTDPSEREDTWLSDLSNELVKDPSPLTACLHTE